MATDLLHKLKEELQDEDLQDSSWANTMKILLDPDDTPGDIGFNLVKEMSNEELRKLRKRLKTVHIKVNETFAGVIIKCPHSEVHPANLAALGMDLKDVTEKVSNLQKSLAEWVSADRICVIRSQMESIQAEMDMIVRRGDNLARKYDEAYSVLDPHLKAVAWEMKEIMEFLDAASSRLDILGIINSQKEASA